MTERITCQWVRERVEPLLDGAESDLAPDERARVGRHVASCSACAREVALAARVRAGLRALPVFDAPAAVIERAEAALAGPPAAARPRVRRAVLRWTPAAAAALVLIAALWTGRERRHDDGPAADAQAVEQAARETAIAFAYLNKYARRAGDIVGVEVDRRLVAPVERAMEKSGMTETKPSSDRSL